jgi:transcriptional regulator GlxA family with amidase domain
LRLEHVSGARLLDAVARIANRLVLDRGAVSVGEAAASAGLSVRQFERRFFERVGIAPK